jgi:phage baseplate assembly protein W
MPGITPKLPLNINSFDGHYGLIRSYKELVKQNFKNLLLTSPGERMMDTDFGVGVRNYLFELDNPNIRADLSARVTNQVAKHLPFIEIVDFSYDSQFTNPKAGDNTLYLRIEYYIIPLGLSDNIELNTPKY